MLDYQSAIWWGWLAAHSHDVRAPALRPQSSVPPSTARYKATISPRNVEESGCWWWGIPWAAGQQPSLRLSISRSNTQIQGPPGCGKRGATQGEGHHHSGGNVCWGSKWGRLFDSRVQSDTAYARVPRSTPWRERRNHGFQDS